MGAAFSRADVKCPFEPLTSLESMPPMGLRQVKVIENHISSSRCYHPPLKDLVYHGFYDGTTPLLLACEHGDFNAVKRIVELWGVDVRSTAVYYMTISPNLIVVESSHQYGNVTVPRLEIRKAEWVKIDVASPLFVAANCGSFDIARYLLKKGADVRAKTACEAHIGYDGSTPLHGAFFDSRHHDETKAAPMARLLLEAGADPSALSCDQTPIWMKPNRYGRYNKCICGVEAAVALINHGLDLSQRDPEFSMTILHHWASLKKDISEQQQSLSVVKLLLDKGADLLARDCRGFTPIISAVLGKPDSYSCRSPANPIALHFLLERDDVPRTDKIDALELVGADILRVSKRAPQYLEAIGYWRRAIQLRQGTKDCEPIPKSPLNLETVKTVEWTTSAELENIIQHPSEYLIQSFLVQLRFVISCNTWKALDSFLHALREHDDYLNQPDRFAHALEMLWAVLETIRCYFPLRTSKLSHWIMRTTKNLVEYLCNLQRDDPLHLTVEIMKISLELISDTDHSYMADCSGTTTKDHMLTLLELIELLVRLPHHMLNQTGAGENSNSRSSKSHETIIRESLNDLVQRERRDEKGRTLLHIACQFFSTSETFGDFFPPAPNMVYSLPSPRLNTIRLLLTSGADPNSCDANGDAPLHVLAKFNGVLVDVAADLLLENGAHFDRVNKSGKTAVDVWIERNEYADEWSDRPSWCHQSAPRPLTCQCARVIRVNKVPYTAEPFTLPLTLQSFVELH